MSEKPSINDGSEGLNKAQLEQRRLHTSIMRAKCDRYFPINDNIETVWISGGQRGAAEIQLINSQTSQSGSSINNYQVDFYLSKEGVKYFGLQNEPAHPFFRVNIIGDSWYAGLLDRESDQLIPAEFSPNKVNPVQTLFFSIIGEKKPEALKRREKSA